MIRAAIVGFGNIGKSVLEAIETAPDFELAGIVSRSLKDGDLGDIKITSNIDNLSSVDVAILCTPSRSIPEIAEKILKKGINTVDSFDIHTSIYELKSNLDKVAKDNNAVSIISAGWDPGTDSVIRCLMEGMAPKGLTYTNFGPGMSMGHTVAVKAIKGVKKALSMTIPLGTGVHRRMVYIELEEGADFTEVSNNIKNDEYFKHDETHVMAVDCVESLIDMGHGVDIIRKGTSGIAQNQLLSFKMHINNPALTGQILVATARAAMHQKPGCYTLIEIPPIDLLPGDREAIIKRIV